MPDTDARIVRDIRMRLEELNQALAPAADAGIYVHVQPVVVEPGDGLAKPPTINVGLASKPWRCHPVDDGVSQQGGTA